MAKVKIIGDPILREVLPEFTDFGNGKKIKQTMFKALDKTGHGIGLAANQIGLRHRCFIFDLRHKSGECGIIFNPVLEDVTSDKVMMTEYCLSVPDEACEIERPQGIRIAGQNEFGDEYRTFLDGWAARVFQHELDHINGILMVDYL